MSRCRHVLSTLLAVVCVASLVSCGNDEAIAGPGDPGGLWDDIGRAVAEVGFGAGDGLTGDGLAGDGLAGDGLAGDGVTSGGVTGQEDAGVHDGGVGRTSLLDAGRQHEPEPVDAGPKDVGPSPPDPALCVEKNSQFLVTQAEALKCDTPFQCTKLAPREMACPCERYYSTRTFAYQNLADLSNEAKNMGCKGKCPPGPCANMDVLIGVCKVGGCIDYDATCKELDAFATLALTEGAKCSMDSECVFAANNDLKCGCSQFYNLKTVGPGKPLFWYMMMLVKAYTAKGCGKNFQCACPSPKSAKCVAGVCVTKF